MTDIKMSDDAPDSRSAIYEALSRLAGSLVMPDENKIIDPVEDKARQALKVDAPSPFAHVTVTEAVLPKDADERTVPEQFAKLLTPGTNSDWAARNNFALDKAEKETAPFFQPERGGIEKNYGNTPEIRAKRWENLMKQP